MLHFCTMISATKCTNITEHFTYMDDTFNQISKFAYLEKRQRRN